MPPERPEAQTHRSRQRQPTPTGRPPQMQALHHPRVQTSQSEPALRTGEPPIHPEGQPIHPEGQRPPYPAQEIQPGESRPEPHRRRTPSLHKVQTPWRQTRFPPDRRPEIRCCFFHSKAPYKAMRTHFGAMFRQKRSSARHRFLFRPGPGLRPRLRHSPKTLFFRASSCCSQRPTPCCSTATWATYGCC